MLVITIRNKKNKQLGNLIVVENVEIAKKQFTGACMLSEKSRAAYKDSEIIQVGNYSLDDKQALKGLKNVKVLFDLDPIVKVTEKVLKVQKEKAAAAAEKRQALAAAAKAQNTKRKLFKRKAK